MRFDGRQPMQLRPVKVTPHFLANPAGSCLIEMGGTRVVCAAMVEETVPPFLKGSGKGWLTAEYSMLPASSSQRVPRDRNKVNGRTQEIQRLIGRSLRMSVNLEAIGERSILVDCDVLDADGGTRTASITGGYIAVGLAVKKLGLASVLKVPVAAISVGVVNGTPLLDLNYEEDKRADVDMNIVQTAQKKFVEIQGTAETQPYDAKQLEALLGLADKGLKELFAVQAKALEVG